MKKVYTLLCGSILASAAIQAQNDDNSNQYYDQGQDNQAYNGQGQWGQQGNQWGQQGNQWGQQGNQWGQQGNQWGGQNYGQGSGKATTILNKIETFSKSCAISLKMTKISDFKLKVVV